MAEKIFNNPACIPNPPDLVDFHFVEDCRIPPPPPPIFDCPPPVCPPFEPPPFCPDIKSGLAAQIAQIRHQHQAAASL
jgi:hypothetical protein